jgi:hypothetical protein
MDSQRRFLHSGELAALAGVSTDTLRHYERKGALAHDTAVPQWVPAIPG